MQRNYSKLLIERSLKKAEKDYKERVDEEIYMLRHNLHFKDRCIIDEEREIFMRKAPSIASIKSAAVVKASDDKDR